MGGDELENNHPWGGEKNPMSLRLILMTMKNE
jgi:hypothetical protein